MAMGMGGGRHMENRVGKGPGCSILSCLRSTLDSIQVRCPSSLGRSQRILKSRASVCTRYGVCKVGLGMAVHTLQRAGLSLKAFMSLSVTWHTIGSEPTLFVSTADQAVQVLLHQNKVVVPSRVSTRVDRTACAAEPL